MKRENFSGAMRINTIAQSRRVGFEVATISHDDRRRTNREQENLAIG